MSEYIEVTLNDGSVLGSPYWEGIVIALSEQDWTIPSSALDFKNKVKRRARIAGVTLEFSDAKSFIQALSRHNFVQAIVVYHKRKHSDFVQ